jgi:hypothetical protein
MLTRFLTILALASALSACGVVKPPLEQAVAQNLRVEEVSVTVSGGQDTLEKYGFTASMLQRDLTATLTRELLAVSEGGKTPVNVKVDVLSVSLTSALPGILRSNLAPYSEIWANLSITNATTGQVILLDRGIKGNDNLGAHGLGAALILFSSGNAPGKVYHDLVAGFSADVRRKLFEWKGFQTAVN